MEPIKDNRLFPPHSPQNTQYVPINNTIFTYGVAEPLFVGQHAALRQAIEVLADMVEDLDAHLIRIEETTPQRSASKKELTAHSPEKKFDSRNFLKFLATLGQAQHLMKHATEHAVAMGNQLYLLPPPAIADVLPHSRATAYRMAGTPAQRVDDGISGRLVMTDLGHRELTSRVRDHYALDKFDDTASNGDDNV